MSHLALIGFMGTGKTTVGRLVAETLGWPFVDVDDAIEEAAGLPVGEIFARHGEPAFRRLEADTIRRLLTEHTGLVIATGGGAVGDPQTRRLLGAHAFTVCLEASPQAILDRTAGTVRPMLDGHPDRAGRVAALLADRRPHYELADVHLDTTNLPPPLAAEEVLRAWGTVKVALGSRSYLVHLGPDLLADPVLYPEATSYRIVTNPAIARLYSGQVVRALAGRRRPVAVDAVPAGERAKSLRQAETLWRRWLDGAMDRGGLVIALGGGVVGDLAGFAAATYMRGVRVVQAPTTLLAQVDASVGGKTAVDLAGVKNIVGAFHQPLAVLADTASLATLPRRELRVGLAEVTKHGVLGDPGLFEYLECRIGDALAADSTVLSHLVRRSCRLKAAVVSEDEREAGRRAALNLGHTFGHGLESQGGLGRLRHGEAVSLGMVAACYAAVRQGMMPAADADRVTSLLEQAGLPVRGSKVPPEAALAAMRGDKKARAGELRFVLPTGLGRVELGVALPPSLILEALAHVQ